MRKIFTVFLIMLGLLALGCAKKAVSKPDTGMEEAAMGEQAMEEPMEEVTMEPQESGMAEQEMAKVETEELMEKPGMPGLSDIPFDFDRYDIKDEAKPVLRELATWLINNDSAVLIEGHCDDRGTNEYNLALGDRRATSVKNFLVASGVPTRKIETVSFGEEKPLCDEQNEACWSRNRRAHFVVTESGR
jgi:peptidoglycan-associated lipoprotein